MRGKKQRGSLTVSGSALVIVVVGVGVGRCYLWLRMTWGGIQKSLNGKKVPYMYYQHEISSAGKNILGYIGYGVLAGQ